MKNNVYAFIFAIAIIVAAALMSNAYLNRGKSDDMISVTGLGQSDFTSDLIVWSGRFEKDNLDLKQAYADLEKDRKVITTYLNSKGITEEGLVYSAVESRKKTRTLYSPNGNYMGEEFTGYALNQTVKIESKEVEKIEKVSREITELLNQGVQLYSESPRYYYTQLADLKIEMISRATEDARVRAEKIAENSGAHLGDLSNARMGIFQITGQNSNEDYSWGGAYNTSSKEKTASITMKLVYNIK